MSIINFTKRKFSKLILLCNKKEIDYDKIYEIIQGTFSYMENANTYKLRKRLVSQFGKLFQGQISDIEINRHLKMSNKHK